MKSETLTQREDLIIRRHILQPGESLPWHTDRCHRFTVVVSGEALSKAMQASPYRDVDIEPTREQMPGSDTSL